MIGGIYCNVLGRDHHISSAHCRAKDGGVGRCILQQADILTGNKEPARSLIVNDLRRNGIEDHDLAQNAGTEEIKLPAAQAVCFGQFLTAAGIVAEDLKSSVFAGGHRGDVEVKIIRHFLSRDKIVSCFLEICVLLIHFAKLPVNVRGNIVHGLDQDRHGFHGLRGQILHQKLQRHIAVFAALHLRGIGGFVLGHGHGRGNRRQVDGNRFIAADGGIGENAVIGADAGLLPGCQCAQIVVERIGTVRRSVFCVIGSCKVYSGVGCEIEHGRRKTVPVSERHLIGL